MADDISTTQENDKNDDNGYAASLLSTPLFTEFETIQCKPEPECSSIHNPIDEDQLVFGELSTYRTPVTAPMIRDPIVLLERCDKIWETLQLIKVVQTEKPVINEENGEDKKEEIQNSDEPKQSVSYNMRHPALRSRNTVPLPFNFSVQKTTKLYPCTICGKHYQERRSLRKHSDRVHGIILPLLKSRRKSRLSNKKNFDKVNQVTLLDKESNNLENLNNGKNPRAKRKIVKTKAVTLQPTMLNKFVKCTLCQQKVISLRKHLINYHKIGGSSNVVEQLESSLLIENGASSKDKKSTSSENVGSKKSSRFAKTNVDGFRIMDNEVDTCKPQIKRKRKFTLSYLLSSKKRRKYNNEHYVLTQHEPAKTRKKTSSNLTNQESHTYPCDICLGIYASHYSLHKHRRIHISRGETKENFHNVKCRYHNSPFNQKNKKLLSSIMSNHTTVGNTNNSTSDVQLNNSKHEIFNKNGEMNKNNNTTCLCGRSFRNPHTLFIHKQCCELYKEDGMSPHTSVSSDSGIGINITIKKNNNSYEIVGKDYNEDQLENSEIHFEENNLSISNTSNHIAKESVNLSARQKKSDKSELSNYSKNHSILKLRDADEDIIIDIEDDGIEFDQNNTPKQIIAQQSEKRYTSKEQNDVKNEQVSNKICTLSQMCQKVLDNSTYKSENAKENEKQGNSLVEYQDNDQIKDQEIHQDNKRKLRSSNRQRLNYEEKFDYFNDNTEVCMKQYNVLSMCGYCHEKFETDRSYYDHQCTVKEGRPFDEFSLELLCFYCKTILDNFTEYDMHMKVKHFDKAYHCYLCAERFASPKLRLQHINLEHNNMSCRFCNEKVNIQIKALHEGYHFGFGHPCHKCKKAYINERNLSYHNYKSRAHPSKTDNRVTCSICLKLVKRRSIRTHMSTHKHNNTCYFCSKVFSNKTGLEFHTMLHHGTQLKLKCNVCGTRFFNKKQLEKHANVDGCNTGIQGVKNRNTASHN